MTKPGQTDGYDVNDFADEIERLAGGEFLDAVLFNVSRPSDELLEKYASEGEKFVEYDRDKLNGTHFTAVGMDLLAGAIWQGSQADPLAANRTLIRHDSAAVANAIMRLYGFIHGKKH